MIIFAFLALLATSHKNCKNQSDENPVGMKRNRVTTVTYTNSPRATLEAINQASDMQGDTASEMPRSEETASEHGSTSSEEGTEPASEMQGSTRSEENERKSTETSEIQVANTRNTVQIETNMIENKYSMYENEQLQNAANFIQKLFHFIAIL